MILVSRQFLFPSLSFINLLSDISCVYVFKEIETAEEIGKMSQMEQNSETARLVGNAGNNVKPSYINLASNICTLALLGIISYCVFQNGATLFSFHPLFMITGWLLLMTSAINAVTPGDLATEWMPIRLRSARHWVIQLCGGISIMTGFIIIVINKSINGKEHFMSLHGKFGLASFILMFVTMLGGLGALYSLKMKHYIAPLYTKLIHSVIGLITFSFGIITILLGIFSHWWTFGEILRYISLILTLFVTLFTILRPTLKIYFRIKERFENTH